MSITLQSRCHVLLGEPILDSHLDALPRNTFRRVCSLLFWNTVVVLAVAYEGACCVVEVAEVKAQSFLGSPVVRTAKDKDTEEMEQGVSHKLHLVDL